MPSTQLPGPIAIIDVETTGLFPLRHDRVVEVAAIVIEDDGRRVGGIGNLKVYRDGVVVIRS
jgi:DNA polymerase III epsilon subunit-like protein